MAIGSIDTASPASNASAGQGDDEIRALKADIAQSFPGWVSAGSADILAATAPELDAAVGLAETALQRFNNRVGTGTPRNITPADDDYTIANIDDAAAVNPVARAARNFLSDADKSKLDLIEAEANRVDNIDDLDDVNISGAVEGDILQLNASGNWIDRKPGFIMPVTESYRAHGATGASADTFRPFFDTVDNNSLSDLGTVDNNSTSGWEFTVAAGKTVRVDINGHFLIGAGTIQVAFTNGTGNGALAVQSSGIDANDVYAFGQGGISANPSTSMILTAGDTIKIHGNSTDLNGGLAGSAYRAAYVAMLVTEILPTS